MFNTKLPYFGTYVYPSFFGSYTHPFDPISSADIQKVKVRSHKKSGYSIKKPACYQSEKKLPESNGQLHHMSSGEPAQVLPDVPVR